MKIFKKFRQGHSSRISILYFSGFLIFKKSHPLQKMCNFLKFYKYPVVRRGGHSIEGRPHLDTHLDIHLDIWIHEYPNKFTKFENKMLKWWKIIKIRKIWKFLKNFVRAILSRIAILYFSGFLIFKKSHPLQKNLQYTQIL